MLSDRFLRYTGAILLVDYSCDKFFVGPLFHILRGQKIYLSSSNGRVLKELRGPEKDGENVYRGGRLYAFPIVDYPVSPPALRKCPQHLWVFSCRLLLSSSARCCPMRARRWSRRASAALVSVIHLTQVKILWG